MNNFELTIAVQDNKSVRARRESGTETSGEVKIDALRRQTIRVFEDWLSQGKINKRNELEVLGTHLYEILFNDDIESSFEQAMKEADEHSQRLRVQLTFQEKAADLADLRWEYLYCPDRETRKGFFMSTKTNLVLSRYIPPQPGPKALSAKGDKLKILIVVAKPNDLAPVIYESLIEMVKIIPNTHVDILDEPTIDNFLEKLEKIQPHVMHFIGHGRFNKAEKNCEIGLLEAESNNVLWKNDKDFADYITQIKITPPHLVLLQLCEGGEPELSGNFAALAPRLLLSGVHAVVAMQYPISDKAARSFFKAFYKEVANGEPIDYAVQAGRWHITLDDTKSYDTRLFGTPVLYMNSQDSIIQPFEPELLKEKTIQTEKSFQGIASEKPEQKQVIIQESQKSDQGSRLYEPTIRKDETKEYLTKTYIDKKTDEEAPKEVSPENKIVAVGEEELSKYKFNLSKKLEMFQKLMAIKNDISGLTPDEMKSILNDKYLKYEKDIDFKSVISKMLDNIEE